MHWIADRGIGFHANKDWKYQIKLHVKNLKTLIIQRQKKIVKLAGQLKQSMKQLGNKV